MSESSSIVAALDAHWGCEILEGRESYKCERCKKLVPALKTTKLEVPPNVLALTLKRHAIGPFGKLNTFVSYEEDLDVTPFLSPYAAEEGVKYILYGVIVHIDHKGSTGRGHYVAFVKTADGKWYECNDASVTCVSAETATSQNAYMLFYHRDIPRAAPRTRAEVEAAAAEMVDSAMGCPAAAAQQEAQVALEGGRAPRTPPPTPSARKKGSPWTEAAAGYRGRAADSGSAVLTSNPFAILALPPNLQERDPGDGDFDRPIDSLDLDLAAPAPAATPSSLSGSYSSPISDPAASTQAAIALAVETQRGMAAGEAGEQWEEVIGAFDRMEEAGLQPDELSYRSLQRAIEARK
mmetsp:Transcript_16663/g.52253  ORF Transcript_16663/g.52253 Transcript_16663/m.52253 type:complete len:351 (-) Transcript_16663:204-1256(-)